MLCILKHHDAYFSLKCNISSTKMSSKSIKISNCKAPTRSSSNLYLQRRALLKFQSAEPKIGGGKIASNLARLNARSRPKAFYVSFVQEQLTKYLKNNQPQCKYDGLDQLLRASKEKKLLEGQLILEVVDISCHKITTQNMYDGWISSCVNSVANNKIDNKARYVHVGVYIGTMNQNHYVVGPGGKDSFIPMMFGTIGLRTFQKAFNVNSTFYVYSPIIENECSFNRDLILKRALGGIGTRYLYQSPGLTSEVFTNVLLGGVSEDSFSPVWKNQNVKSLTAEYKNQQIDRAKYFHTELTSQIRQLSHGIHLSLSSYINRKDRYDRPWFRQLIRSFVDLMVAIKLNDSEKCKALITNHCIQLSSYSSNGETALTYAARLGRTSICILLLDFSLGFQYKMALGADVNSLDANGNNALLLSFMGGHFDTSNLLISLGANQNDPRFTKTLCDYYSKLFFQNDIEQCEHLLQSFKQVISVEVFYNYYQSQSIKEGHLNEYTQLMDNIIDY